MSNKMSACPLDCYDACSIVYDNGMLQGNLEHELTQGFLCPHLNHYSAYEPITTPRYRGKSISLESAVTILKESIKACEASKILHYRGHGNFALMQGVSDYFFSKIGATLTSGSLCDGAGEAGILEGRGSNKVLDLEQIKKAEVVIVWGRNLHVTNSHLLPHIKGKKLIVIDPVVTKTAAQADHHIQLKPHGDLFLALLLSRFVVINDCEDIDFLEQHTEAFQEFYELTQTIRIKSVLESIDVTLGDIGKVLELVSGSKTVILVGVGVQKHREGAAVLRAIDAFAAVLGLFGKEGCGVGYLGASQEGIENPFVQRCNTVPKATADFSAFDLVFVQGANPLNQMPASEWVKERFAQAKTTVYYGLYENETSEAADLVIPTCNFLQKSDIRSSYGSNHLLRMPQIVERSSGIGEYDLMAELCNSFDIALHSEQEYIEHFASFAEEKATGTTVKSRNTIAYKEGFDTDSGRFVFMDEFEFEYTDNTKLFLITCKSAKSLNSQFQRDHYVYLHPDLGFSEGEEVDVVSEVGQVRLVVKHNRNLREDCVLIHSGVHGVNNLTPSYVSYEGNSAVYQEKKVEVKRCK